MFHLRRKKVEEDIDVEGKKDLDGEKPVKKVRRRKKAEPQKPWGKLERIVVLLFLLAAPILSIIFLFNSRNSKTAKQIPIPAPQIVTNIILAPAPDTSELKNELTNETQSLQGTYGIWVQALDNSYSLGINETTQFDGASLFKLPLMIAYYQGVDNGRIDPGTNYSLKFSDAQAGAGVLATLPPGTVVTYQDMVDYMGKNSDNSAFAIMENVLGADMETGMISKLGMTNTDFANSITTPYDVGLVFYKLANSNLISNNSQQKLFTSLTNTDYETLIPAAIPNTIRIVHKYGGDDGELNDAGIVYAGKPFVLVILSKDINEDEAQTEIPKLAQIVYDWATK